jgi:hypothetical protein
MSKQDAESVIEHLEKAKQAARPLKDADLTKKIETAREHVEKKADPKQG